MFGGLFKSIIRMIIEEFLKNLGGGGGLPGMPPGAQGAQNSQVQAAIDKTCDDLLK